MSNETPPEKTPPMEPSALAALLSYLVPGLGQIYQGRTVKGVLFMVSLYGLFFYGMYLGSWKNVYLRSGTSKSGVSTVVDRLTFVGQAPIGIAAWPAIWQYKQMSREFFPAGWRDFESTPTEDQLNRLQSEGDKYWDLGVIYTIIAGVLNLLVMYDAYAGPIPLVEETEEPARQEEEGVTV